MNDRHYCETIKQTVTAAICAMRLSSADYHECGGCAAKDLIKRADGITPRATLALPMNNKPTEVDKMKGVTDRKICVGYDKADGTPVECGQEFEPTSNVQKRCPKCREAWRKELNTGRRELLKPINRVSRAPEGDGKTGTDARSYSSNNKCSREGCLKYAVIDGECTRHSNETKGVVKKTSPEGGKIPPPPMKPARPAAAKKDKKLPPLDIDYSLTVNFSGYPKLHDRLMVLAEKEYRSPGMQLLYLLNQEFEKLEAQA